MQMIAGTVKNSVKLDILAQSWEQKKATNNVLTKQERNKRANMTPEERMLEHYQEELIKNREQSKNNAIAYKIMDGEDLTYEEEQYLAKNNPALLNNYRKVKAERHAYEDALKKCKTKEEVQRLKINTMAGYLSELKSAKGEAKLDKAQEIIGKIKNIQKAELEYMESGEYENLPSEAEEAVERDQEKIEENEAVFEYLEDATKENETDNVTAKENETDDVTEGLTQESGVNDIKAENRATDNNAEEPVERKDNLNDILANKIQAKEAELTGEKNILLDKRKKHTEKDILEEIDRICKTYIPNRIDVVM